MPRKRMVFGLKVYGLKRKNAPRVTKDTWKRLNEYAGRFEPGGIGRRFEVRTQAQKSQALFYVKWKMEPGSFVLKRKEFESLKY
jgi:hypothetical protein